MKLIKERLMEKEVLSMIGHVKDTPRVLMKTYQIRQEFMTDFVNAFMQHDFKKIYFLGSGTSNHVSIVIKNMFVKLLHIEGVAIPPTHFKNHTDPNPAGVFKKEEIAVICFSQHGDSISTCEAARKAKEDGYYTIGVTEQLNSVLETLTDCYCHLVCEEEEIGPETRGYTQTIFQFYILAIEIAKRKGYISIEEYKKLDQDAYELAENFDSVVEESIAWYQKNREEFLQMDKSSIAGYGYNWATALEARLKFFETYSRPCTGYEFEEQMHGPFRAYVDKNVYFFLIISEGEAEKKRALDAIPYYKDAFSSHVFVVTGEKDFPTTEKDLKFTYTTTDILSPMVYIVPFQVLAARICEDVGIDTKVSPVKKKYFSSHYLP